MKEIRRDLTLIFEALLFAAEKHKKQRRKDSKGTSYINHPIAVAYYFCKYAEVFDVDALVAAILHDTLEDTDTTPREIGDKFGIGVLQLVQEVTDDKNLSRTVRRDEQVRTVAGRSTSAKLIRIADKISNVSDILRKPPPNWDPETRVEYLDWTERVIGKIKGIDPGLESIYDAKLKEARDKYAV